MVFFIAIYAAIVWRVIVVNRTFFFPPIHEGTRQNKPVFKTLFLLGLRRQYRRPAHCLTPTGLSPHFVEFRLPENRQLAFSPAKNPPSTTHVACNSSLPRQLLIPNCGFPHNRFCFTPEAEFFSRPFFPPSPPAKKTPNNLRQILSRVVPGSFPSTFVFISDDGTLEIFFWTTEGTQSLISHSLFVFGCRDFCFFIVILCLVFLVSPIFYYGQFFCKLWNPHCCTERFASAW